MCPSLFLTYCPNIPVMFLSVLQINLRLILVSGKTKEFLFSPNDSAADIAKHVYDNWPMGEWLLSDTLVIIIDTQLHAEVYVLLIHVTQVLI